MHAVTRPDGIEPAPAPRPAPEWRWGLIWSLVILAAGCLPYLVAWAATPAAHQFTGLLVNPFDGHSYLAKMRQGWEGNWLFHLTYTPEPHAGAALYLLYLGLGHIARLAGLPLAVVYHAARVLAGLALLMTVYVFVARLSPAPRARRWLFGLAGATVGLGWLGSMLGLLPIDLWVPEAFAFFSLLTNPHFPLALALMLAVVYLVMWPASGTRCWLLPAVCGALLGAVTPFSLATLYATLALYLLLLAAPLRAVDALPVRPALIAAAGVATASAPWLIYDLWVFTTNPVFAGWSTQNVTPTPSPLNLVLGFGLLAPLAVVGAVDAVRRRDRAALMLLVWAVVTLVLIHAPVALQRRLITGLGLPLALLAGLAATAARPVWGEVKAQAGGEVGLQTLLAKLALGLGLLGSAFLLVIFPAGALGKATSRDATALFYLTDDESAAMQWLDANARGAVALAPPRLGTMLPGQAGVRVFYGHPFETLNAAARRAQTDAFFAGQLPDAEWRRLVDRYTIGYVLVGAGDPGSDAVRLPDGLESVYQHGDVSIYRVR
jgi:hypothetical protein